MLRTVGVALEDFQALPLITVLLRLDNQTVTRDTENTGNVKGTHIAGEVIIVISSMSTKKTSNFIKKPIQIL